METYGIPPKQHWKLFEHEGYQVLVHIEEDEDEAGKYQVVMEGWIEPLGATTSLKIGNGDIEVAQTIFSGFVDADHVVPAFLRNVGPTVQAILDSGVDDLDDDE